MYDIVIFDLDGTISDSREGIINSFKYALKKMKIEVPSYEFIRNTIGTPLHRVFSETFELNEEDVEKTVTIWREYFSEKGMFENIPYEGMGQLFRDLGNNGSKLGVATVKPQPFVERILEHFGFDKYFASVMGSLLNGDRTDKKTLIGNVLTACEYKETGRAVMVGDRILDVQGAHACGIDAVGVSYGFGTKEELESGNPVKVATTVRELSEFLLQT